MPTYISCNSGMLECLQFSHITFLSLYKFYLFYSIWFRIVFFFFFFYLLIALFSFHFLNSNCCLFHIFFIYHAFSSFWQKLDY